MLIQIVKFESALTEAECERVALERKPDYAAFPGLIQKYYVNRGNNRYAGIMIWESAEALAKFRESDLARTVGPAYGVIGTPEVCVHDLMFPLREMDLAYA